MDGNEWVLAKPGWHGVGSIDRAGAGFLSNQSSSTRNGDFPLYHVNMTLIRLKINTSMNQGDSIVKL